MRQKQKVTLGIIAAILAIALFGVGIYAIEKISDRGGRGCAGGAERW